MTEEQVKTIFEVADAWFVFRNTSGYGKYPTKDLTVEQFKYAKYAELVKTHPELALEFTEDAYIKFSELGKTLQRKIKDLEAAG